MGGGREGRRARAAGSRRGSAARTLLGWTALAPVLVVIGGCGALNSGGFFDETPERNGRCETTPGFAGGTEDIVADPAKRRFYVSADPRRERLAEPERAGELRGEVHLVDLDARGELLPARPATLGAPTAFAPHGMDLWTDGKTKLLFVINHPPGAPSQVEIFEVEENGDLTWRERLKHPLLHRPNDLVAVGPRSFYASNDHGTRRSRVPGKTSVWELLEDTFAAPAASIVYVNGAHAEVAARWRAFANGLAISNGELYLTEASAGRLVVFELRPGTPRLRFKRSWRIGPGPDNIYLEGPRRLWIAGHNKAFALRNYSKDPRKLSPGRVEIVDPQTGGRRLVFETDGSDLSAVSVGLPVGDKVLLGSIFAPEVVLCPRLPG